MRHLAAVVALVGLLAVSASLIEITPPFESFAVTVVIAIGWCVWLEAHPDDIDNAATHEPAARLNRPS
jgi:hypothetical protein